MPTYMVHAFRWPRPLIRIHIILQNIDDAAPEWLMAPQTRSAMMTNFKSIYTDIMPALPNLRFIEQYDPLDESVESKSQPFAYVCDVVHEVKLGVEIDEVRGRGVHNDAWTAMMDLRDKLAPGEKVSWFVVVCGDTERWAPPEANGGLTVANGSSKRNGGSKGSRGSWEKRDSSETSRPSTSRSLKKIFGGRSLRKSKSTKSMNGSLPMSPEFAPPLPTSPLTQFAPTPPPKTGPNISHVYARLPPELRNPNPVPRPPPGRQYPGTAV